MVNAEKSQISPLFIGDTGVKSIFVGTEKIYERPGGYVYLVLNTKPEEQPSETQQ